MSVTIRDWTFTHFWVRPVVKAWFERYHKHVTYSGWEHVNWNKPLIFAASHQSAFTDALCLILPARYTNDRFIYPLVRADAFGNNKATDWILTAFHMLPVYRPKDNVDIKERNDTVFTDCYEILSKNRNLLIHPEGNCYPIKKVRPFKKGLARIAFGAEQINNFDLDIEIIPVGINYRKATEERGGIHIQFGKPVSVAGYKKEFTEHKATAITGLTRLVEQRVKGVTVDIQTDEHYELVEQILGVSKRCLPQFSVFGAYSREEVEFEQQLIRRMEKKGEEKPEFWERLKEDLDILEGVSKKCGLSLEQALIERYSLSRIMIEGAGYSFMLPLFLYGWLNNIVPWHLIHQVAGNVQDRQFINSARMAAGLVVFPVCYLLQAGVFWLVSAKGIWALYYLLSLPFAGMLSIHYYERWKEWQQQLKLRRLPEDIKNKLRDATGRLISRIGFNTTSSA